MYDRLAKVLFVGFLGFNTGLMQAAADQGTCIVFKDFTALSPKLFDLFNNFPSARTNVINRYKKSGTEDRDRELKSLNESGMLYNFWLRQGEEASKQKIHFYALLLGKRVGSFLQADVLERVVMDYALDRKDFCDPEYIASFRPRDRAEESEE